MALPIKVLHIVANLRHGGVQSWVLELIRKGSECGVSMDVLTYANQKWPLQPQVEQAGGRVYGLADHRNPLSLFRAMSGLHRDTKYDAVHAHEMYNNGLSLSIARVIGVPVRISHAHNSDQAVKPTGLRRAYNGAMQETISVNATRLLAVSNGAGIKLYGKRWSADPRAMVAPCGVSFPEPTAIESAHLKNELGIPSAAKVVGHVGRFTGQKNHEFIIKIFKVLAERDPNIWLVLVGTGDLVDPIREEVKRLGIAGRVIFTGPRDDVQDLFDHVFDAFLFPSLFEGLGLVLLEAQAAGIQSLISDRVPHEATVVAPLVERMSLEQQADKWADRLEGMLGGAHPVSLDQARTALRASPFDIESSAQTMFNHYRSAQSM